MTTEDKQEVLFMLKMTDHFVTLIREYAEHLDHIGSEMTATEALDFFADSLDMTGDMSRH
jgi:hypothetical protein